MTIDDVLYEAVRAGLRQDERHEVAIRYRAAEKEYNRCADIKAFFRMGRYEPPAVYFANRDAHATKKAKNYIENHRRTL